MDNLWIASLSAADRKRIEPHLSERPFEHGQVIFEVGEPLDEVWFPTRGIISLMTVLDGKTMVETGVIGREGVVGVTCGPLNGRASSRAISQMDGLAACCPADAFSDALSKSDTMRIALSRFTENLLAQVQQTAACNAQHRLDERLARWLLTLHDRSEQHRIDLTQADIAGMLGVRRATVSEVGSVLEDKGLIKRGRGWVEILNRKALEGAACGCYRIMRRVGEDLGVSPPNGHA